MVIMLLTLLGHLKRPVDVASECSGLLYSAAMIVYLDEIMMS